MKNFFKCLLFTLTIVLSLGFITGCTTSSKNKTYTLGDTFEFDDLKITLGTNLVYTTMNDKYSDYYKKTVIKIPVTIENLKDESHGLNMFYYNFFGSNGTEINEISIYYENDGIDNAGDLRKGASYTKYFYVIYDGDGTYALELENWVEKITVEFEVKK